MTGKKRGGLMKSARKQNWFALVTAETDRVGAAVEILPPTGRGHPKIIINYLGFTMKSPVPSSERPGGCHKYLATRVRKFIEDCQARTEP